MKYLIHREELPDFVVIMKPVSPPSMDEYRRICKHTNVISDDCAIFQVKKNLKNNL